jgi:hypothetical protein
VTVFSAFCSVDNTVGDLALGIKLKEQIGGGVTISGVDDSQGTLADVPLGSSMMSIDGYDVSERSVSQVKRRLGEGRSE